MFPDKFDNTDFLIKIFFSNALNLMVQVLFSFKYMHYKRVWIYFKNGE